MISRPIVSLTNPMFESVLVVPSEPYSRKPPRIIGAPDDVEKSILQNAKIDPVIPPEGRVGRLGQVVVLKRGILMNSDYSILRESLINMDNSDRFDAEIGPAYDAACGSIVTIPRITDDKPHVMLKQTWDGNYGHWLIESLPRLEVVKRVYGLNGFNFVVSANASPEMRKVYIDTLVAMGVSAESIIFLPDETWSIPNLIYPTPLTIQPWVKSPFVVQTLEGLGQALNGVAPNGPERLYVSRNNWYNRRLLNEEPIKELLAARGYIVVHPELYSVSEQITLFSNARLVVGTLGAALTNIVFSRRGVNLLALATERMGDDFYWDLVSLKGGLYTSLHGKATETERGMHSDFTIDIGQLSSALSAFED